jgi:hypothetical protein
MDNCLYFTEQHHQVREMVRKAHRPSRAKAFGTRTIEIYPRHGRLCLEKHPRYGQGGFIPAICRKVAHQ